MGLMVRPPPARRLLGNAFLVAKRLRRRNFFCSVCGS